MIICDICEVNDEEGIKVNVHCHSFNLCMNCASIILFEFSKTATEEEIEKIHNIVGDNFYKRRLGELSE